ncbi:MAG: hypothetical protein GY794_00580 [bacterium]|nr:hypothetical protein [bacterium]
MRKFPVIVGVGLLLVFSTGLLAQNAPAESVIDHIPAGTMGYVVVNNIQDTAGTFEKFAASIGVLPPSPPDAPAQSMILPMLRQAARLGDGFNPNAGAAIVMLDPKPFGINVAALAASAVTGEEPDEKTAKALANGVPFVIYVPGSSVKGVFGNYEIGKADGGLSTVNLRMGKMFAVKKGSYILLSPNKAALNSVKAAKITARTELSKSEAKLIKRNNIAYYINAQNLSPVIKAAMEVAGKQAASEEPEAAALINTYMSMIEGAFDQIKSDVGGLRIDNAGIVLESQKTAKPDSALAKTMAATAAITTKGASVLDSLPSLPYVLAVGAAGGMDNCDFLTKAIDKALATEPLATKLTAETKAKTKKTIAGLIEQITGFQIVAGGAPAGKGVVGLAWAIKCKDSAKFKALLADKADLIQTLATTLIDDGEAKGLKIPYNKGVEKCGDVSVDTIEITHPEMLKMSERERGEMTKAIGEDKIRFLIAAPDKNTVVVTFGGTTAMMAKAIASASGKGPIPTATGTSAAMAVLPKDPQVLVFLNLGNMLNVVRTGMGAFIENPEQLKGMQMMIPQLQCKTPIALASKFKGNTAHSVVYISTDLVREVVPKVQQAIMMMMGGMGGGGLGGPPPDPSE